MPNATDKDEIIFRDAVDKITVIPVTKHEDGELMLEFPDKLLDAMSWEEGDVLIWTELDDGNGYLVEKATTYE